MLIFRTAVLAAPLLLALTGCSADDSPPAEATPSALLVASETVQQQDQYQAVQRFSGQVEAARSSSLGFELGGELARVMVDEGARVSEGQILARLDQQRLRAARAEAQAALSQAEAQSELASATFRRIEGAREFNGVSPQDLDEARERAKRSTAAAAAARASLERLEIDLARSELRAPYDAAVIRRHADEGEVVAPGQPIVDVQEASALRVRLSVSGDALQTLSEGTAVTLQIDDQPVAATVAAVIARRNLRTRAVEVLFDIDPGAAARVGDIAELRAERSVRESGFWLPLDALSEGARGVWQVLAVMPLDRRDAEQARTTGATHRLENRPIEILYEEADRVYARGALRDGDRIVASGQQRVVAGQTVRVDERVDEDRPDAASGQAVQ